MGRSHPRRPQLPPPPPPPHPALPGRRLWAWMAVEADLPSLAPRLPPPWGPSHPRPRPAGVRWAAAAAAAAAAQAAPPLRAGPAGWRRSRPCTPGSPQGLCPGPQPRRRPRPAHRPRAQMARATPAPARTRSPGATLAQSLAAAQVLAQVLAAAPGGCWRARPATELLMPARRAGRAQRRSSRSGGGWHSSPTLTPALRHPALVQPPDPGLR